MAGAGRKKGDVYKTHLWPEGHRECVTCLKVLPFSMFHKHAQCHMGYNTVCKSCRVGVSKKQWVDKSIESKMLNRCKSRAALKDIEFNLTPEDLVIPPNCPVLNVPFDTSNDYTPSVDRIDPSKGYISGNIQIISNKANRMKSNATHAELLAFAKWINGVCEI